jgi:hypothetical protein
MKQRSKQGELQLHRLRLAGTCSQVPSALRDATKMGCMLQQPTIGMQQLKHDSTCKQPLVLTDSVTSPRHLLSILPMQHQQAHEPVVF